MENTKEQKTFVCSRCHRAFPRKSKLKRHMERKTPCDVITKPSKCLYCPKQMDGCSDKQIQNHMYYCKRKHNGEKHEASLHERVAQLEARVQMLETVVMNALGHMMRDT